MWVVGWGWWGAMKWWENTHEAVTHAYGLFIAVDSPKSSQIS